MGLFSLTPEQKAAKQAAWEKQQADFETDRRRVADERTRAEFPNSPAGRAQAEKVAGRKVFQIEIPLSQTQCYITPWVGAFADTRSVSSPNHIEAIESKGWRLENVGYVYRMTGSESRDKYWGTGQQESVSGEVVGIYIFRAND